MPGDLEARALAIAEKKIKRVAVQPIETMLRTMRLEAWPAEFQVIVLEAAARRLLEEAAAVTRAGGGA
jgi:hypothetical protein